MIYLSYFYLYLFTFFALDRLQVKGYIVCVPYLKTTGVTRMCLCICVLVWSGITCPHQALVATYSLFLCTCLSVSLQWCTTTTCWLVDLCWIVHNYYLPTYLPILFSFIHMDDSVTSFLCLSVSFFPLIVLLHFSLSRILPLLHAVFFYLPIYLPTSWLYLATGLLMNL